MHYLVLFLLFLGKLSSLTDAIIAEIKKEFAFMLPSFENEIATWRAHTTEVYGCEKLFDAAVLAHKSFPYYPNIHAILLLLLTIPVGSCSSERSFSSLRRLKTWCRNSMTNKRLDSLAMGFINRERTPSPEKILQVWDQSGHRKIAIAFQE